MTDAASTPTDTSSDRIFTAARSEFAKRGFHGARVASIAKAAGCNVAIIYRHWVSKEDLFLDVLFEARKATGGVDAPAEAVFAGALRGDLDHLIVARERLDRAPAGRAA